MERPLYHFTPPQGWCNDPNGLVFDGVYYHMFYQYHPHSLNWGPMHWGHARSRDLYTWEHLPIALYPDECGAAYSGSAVMDGDKMVLVYTCHGHDGTETQAIAYSTDAEHTVFEKFEGNPVIPNPGRVDFRDPKVFRKDENGWHMVVAAGDRVLLYVSPDLVHWEQTGAFGAPEYPVAGCWECPDLFTVKADDGTEKWALVVSLNLDAKIGGGKTMYFIGDFDGKTFRADSLVPVPIDNGMFFYAGVTFWGAPKDQRIMIAWMSNWGYSHAPEALGWRGQMSIPRALSLIQNEKGYRIASSPVAPPQAIARQMAGATELQIVTDTYSVEVFAPATGAAMSQVLFE